MIKTVLFDLDGTLLPMDEEKFTKVYFYALGKRMVSFGYAPEGVTNAILSGLKAMIKNDGKFSNEEVFWKTLHEIYGDKIDKDKPKFDEFYLNEYKETKSACGYNPESKEIVNYLKQKKIPMIVATNPVFPRIATFQRLDWAGLNKDDFLNITTYDNSNFCKPNPKYYEEILKKFKIDPSTCLMVGNDTREDMIASTLGLQVFLVTDCLINKDNVDINQYPHGTLADLLNYLKNVLM